MPASAPLGLVPLRVVENVGQLPALPLGQIAWAVSGKRIPLWTGFPLAALAWGEYAWAGVPGLGGQATVYRYDLDLALGLVVFLAALAAERSLRPTAWFGHLADRSYSLYLLAVVVRNALYPVVGYPVALVAGLAVTMLGVEVVHRYVGPPVHAVGAARHRPVVISRA